MPTRTLFLCGDVMTGRGVDQILPSPSRPILYEPYVKSAQDYVQLAERTNGPIPRQVAYTYPWGEALGILDRRRPDARIVNLETSITTSEDAEPKGINYRMHPANAPVLTAAHLSCCGLANNHVLDWGQAGLLETLQTLATLGIPVAGAGGDLDDAQAPVVLPMPGGGRVLVFAFATPDCGVPPEWRAGARRPGVNLLDGFSGDAVVRRIRAARAPGDIVVASVHWGANWGYDVPAEHRRLAHQLIDEGDVHVVHGHSSHHAKGIEMRRGRPIIYGCGDFITDYEGISGHAEFRGDLALMYFVTVDPAGAGASRLTMVPLRIRQFRLGRPSGADRAWLRSLMTRECRRFGTSLTEREGEFVIG